MKKPKLYKSDLFERLWQGTENTAIIIEKP